MRAQRRSEMKGSPRWWTRGGAWGAMVVLVCLFLSPLPPLGGTDQGDPAAVPVEFPHTLQTAALPVPQAFPTPTNARSWYQRPLVLALFSIAGFTLLAGYLQWRTAALGRARRRLQHMLTARSAKVREQNKKLEDYNRELVETNRRLRETVEEKSRLLGVATHDLKNPLFGMRALSEIVLETEPLSDRARRKVDLIRESAQETLELINDLMASAASTAEGALEPEPVDVGALTEWVVHSFLPQAHRKDQMLHCTVPDAPCVVAGDRRKLREAMNNLVSNALKYSAPRESVHVSVEQHNRHVVVSVSDHGPGLSSRDQEQLFAPFQRLTPDPTGDEGSSGLGLYIVKQIVDLHEGRVEVDSTLGDGSTFSLHLPIMAGDPASEEARSADAAAGG